MKRFNIGDRVRIVRAGPPHAHMNGTITLVCSDLVMFNGRFPAHQLNLPGQIFACPSVLELHDYDGDEPAKWDDCQWRPKDRDKRLVVALRQLCAVATQGDLRKYFPALQR